MVTLADSEGIKHYLFGRLLQPEAIF